MQDSQLCQIERSYLIAAVKSVSRFCGKPSHFQASVQNVLLRFDGERLVAAATDLDQFATVCAPAHGQPFAALAPLQAALDWLARVRSETVAIHLPAPERVEFLAHDRRSRITLLASPEDEFPTMPDVEGGVVLRVQAAAFVEAVKAVLPFAPKAARRSWHGRTPAIHLRVESNQLTVAACDAKRFHQRNVKLSSDPLADDIQFAVSPSALGNLIRLIAENDFSGVELTITKSEKYVSIFAGSNAAAPLFAVHARLLDVKLNIEKVQGNFDDAAGSFVAETKALSRAVRRLARISKTDNNRVELHTGQGVVSVRARSAELGVALEEVPADVKGQSIQLAFDQKQLADVLKGIKGEQVVIEFQRDPRKVARVGGVLIVPVESFVIEDARRLAKRAADEAVAAKADIAALANVVEDQLREWQGRSIFVDVTQAVFRDLAQVIGNNSTWPEALQKLPHDLKALLRERIADDLVRRGVLQRNADAWQVRPKWANDELGVGEAERRERARVALRDGVASSIKNLRSADKIAYALVLVDWHCSAQDQPSPYRGCDLSFAEASDVRSRFDKVLNDVKNRFEPQEQGGSDE